MKALFAGGLFLLVAACAQFSVGNLTVQQRAFALVSDMESALVIAHTYEGLPRCSTTNVITCSKDSVVEEIRRVVPIIVLSAEELRSASKLEDEGTIISRLVLGREMLSSLSRILKGAV